MIELILMLMLLTFGGMCGFILGICLQHPAWAIYSLRRLATYIHLAANYIEIWCSKREGE